MEMVPIYGFAPDRPTTTPGVIIEAQNLVPTERGFGGSPSPVNVTGVGTLAAPCRGAAVVTIISGSRRIFAGTATRMYELTGTTWTDVSRGGLYTGGTEARWSFAQFGSTTIAANDTQVLQASTTSGAFADIATSPIARIVFSVAEFVMALNTSDGTYGDQADRWWCSGLGDHTTWTPSVTTQANTGRLVQGGGDLVAGLALGRQAVAYKTRAMFLGTYVGGAAVWQWEQIPGEQGCVGPDAVCDAGGVHVFVGDDNIWRYDGVRAVPIADDLRNWFFTNSSPQWRFRSIVQYERQANRVWIFFPSSGSADGTPDRTIVYHVATGKWGRADVSVQAAIAFVTPGLTIDGLTSVAATMNTLPDTPLDSQFWLASGRSLAVFNGSGQVQTITGGATVATWTTGDIGADDDQVYMSEARIRFLRQPSWGAMSGQTFDNIGGSVRAGAAATLADGSFNGRQSARWHRLTFSLGGDCEFAALGTDARLEARR